MTEEWKDTDDNVLHLDMSDGPQKVLDILHQTAANAIATTVETVCLSSDFPSPLRAVALDDLVLQVLGSILALPKVKHLRVSYASGTFPIHLLMEALTNYSGNASEATTSPIDSLLLLGAKLAYKETLKASEIIRNRGQRLHLRSITLENCSSESFPSRLGKGRQKPIDMLISALSTLSSLETLSINSIHKSHMKEIPSFPFLKELYLTRLYLSETTLSNVCQSPKPETIHLDSTADPPPDRILQSLAVTLADNSQTTNFRKLRIAFPPGRLVDNEYYRAFWESLHANETIEDLQFIVKGTMSASFGIPIATALQHNRSLQRLQLHTRLEGYGNDQTSLEKSMKRMADSLHSNETLKHFSFHLLSGLRGFSEKEIGAILVDPFHKVLKGGEQFVLESLSLEYRSLGKLPLTEEVQFHLDLNQAGRRNLLLGNATSQDWLNVVLSNAHNLNVVFFFLSRNPLLCRSLLLGL